MNPGHRIETEFKLEKLNSSMTLGIKATVDLCPRKHMADGNDKSNPELEN